MQLQLRIYLSILDAHGHQAQVFMKINIYSNKYSKIVEIQNHVLERDVPDLGLS